IIALGLLVPVLTFAAQQSTQSQTASNKDAQTNNVASPANAPTVQKSPLTQAASKKSSPPAASQATSPPATEKTARQINPAASAISSSQPAATDAIAPPAAQKLAQQASPPTQAQDHQHSVPTVQTTGQPQTSGPMVGDAAAGRQVFRKCQACHSLEPAKNM